MTIRELKVTLVGPLFRIHEFEIESIDLLQRIEEDGDEASVTLSNFHVSDDNILDVFITVGAPNRTVYEVKIGGTTDNGNDLDFSEEFTVTRNGRLRISIERPIDEL